MEVKTQLFSSVTMTPTSSKVHSIPVDILDDLCSRFIINVPGGDRTDLVRICFQVELARWFYLDFYCTDESTNVYPCGMKEFTAHIFQHIPYLQKHLPNLENILDNWREYKQAVPTHGAILLNEDLTHVLLVQSYWAKASWGFPKGKVNQDEEAWNCAIREVYEETGFDIKNLLSKNDYIESYVHEQIVRLYIIAYVPQTTKFQPRTRNEIKSCDWFPIADLPTNRKDMTPKLKMGVSPNAFFMVLPFVKRLKRWIAERIHRTNGNPNNNSKRLRHKSLGDIEGSNNKNKNKPIVNNNFQREINEYQICNSSNAKVKNVNSSQKNMNTGNNTNNLRKDKKTNPKRQLFANSTNGFPNMPSPQLSEKQSTSSSSSEWINGQYMFLAKSWLNFKFDKRAIWESMG